MTLIFFTSSSVMTPIISNKLAKKTVLGEALEQVAQKSYKCPIPKARLGGALGNLVSWVAPLPTAGVLELNDLKGSFQPKAFYDTMIL